MKITRRHLLAGLAASGAGLAMPAVFTGHFSAYGRATNKLAIPDVMTGTMRQGRRVFDLEAKQGRTQFFAGKSTPTFGYNGTYLGPVLRVKDGDKVTFNVQNNLPETITTHWHGLHLPAFADGGPHQKIKPSQTWSPAFEIKQKAATFWYHPHQMSKTGEHVYKGLAGLIIVDDDEVGSLSLPSDYGVDDIPLIVQDRKFTRDGQLQYISAMPERMAGVKGNIILVNGTVNPVLTIKRQRTRFRFLNGSNSRVYNFGFDDGRSFLQIATDGSLLEAPVRRQRVRLAPGERAEILVDFEANSGAVLMSYPDRSAATGRGSGAMMRMMGMDGNNQTLRIMELRAGKLEASNRQLPQRLSQVPNWRPAQANRTRRFDLQGMGMMGGAMRGGMMNMWRINGRSMKLSRIDEIVKLGDIEIWEISNSSSMLHPFHVHDIQFRILTRNGRPVQAHERGLKDTVVVDPGETVRVIAKFEDYADPNIPYMYHCHNLEHEDTGMMGQFTVVA